MCGRFVVARATSDLLPDLLSEFPELARDDERVRAATAPNYNVAPTNPVAAVRQRHGERELATPRWGFVPSWYTDLKKRPQPINARIETVATSGMFRKAFATGRCIIPADGYYEWVLTEHGKQPHYVFAPDAALAMAGIVTAWPDPAKDKDDPDPLGAERRRSSRETRTWHRARFTTACRRASRPTRSTPGSTPTSGPTMRSALLNDASLEVADGMVQHEVSKDANSVRNNGPHLIEPL